MPPLYDCSLCGDIFNYPHRIDVCPACQMDAADDEDDEEEDEEEGDDC